MPERGQPRLVKLIRDDELQYQAGRHQAFMLWSGLWVDKICGEESPGVHCGVMLRYAAALEEATKEGNWPLFRSGPLEVPGTYALSAPWKVAAVAAVLVQVSELGSERNDPTVWGVGGPGCLEDVGTEKVKPS